MRPSSASALVLGLVVVGLAGPFGLDRARAQASYTLARTARGGLLARTARHQFEVFAFATGLRVFPTDAAGTPLDASRLAGTATFYHPNSPQPWFARPLAPAPAAPGPGSPSLDLALDLRTVPPSGARVVIEVTGLSDPAEPSVAFTVPVEFAAAPQPAVPYAYRPVYSRAGGVTYYYYPSPAYRVAARPAWARQPRGWVIDNAPGPDDEVRRGAPGLGPSDTGPGGASRRSERRERGEGP